MIKKIISLIAFVAVAIEVNLKAADLTVTASKWVLARHMHAQKGPFPYDAVSTLTQYFPNNTPGSYGKLSGSTGTTYARNSREVGSGNFYFSAGAEIDGDWTNTANNSTLPFQKLSWALDLEGKVTGTAPREASGKSAVSGYLLRTCAFTVAQGTNQYIAGVLELTGSKTSIDQTYEATLEATQEVKWGESYIKAVWDQENTRWTIYKRLMSSTGTLPSESSSTSTTLDVAETGYAKITPGGSADAVVFVSNVTDPRSSSSWETNQALSDAIGVSQSGKDDESGDNADGTAKVTVYATFVGSNN